MREYLTLEDKGQIAYELAIGENVQTVASRYGVRSKVISSINKNFWKSWSFLSNKRKYDELNDRETLLYRTLDSVVRQLDRVEVKGFKAIKYLNRI